MGSKSQLLGGALGDVVLAEASAGERFVDLFAGSASVSHFVAERVSVAVTSVDVQHYVRPLALAITARGLPFDSEALRNDWLKSARESFEADPRGAPALRASRAPSKTSILEARRLCARESSAAPGSVWHAYGGHYFSPSQSLAFDCMIEHLPTDAEVRWLALGSLLRAATRCSASPGHTAQPFQPSPTSMPYIALAWEKDAFKEVSDQIQLMAPRHAIVPGSAVAADGADLAAKFSEEDVIFCDPPYSEAQYSRFYHVLEGIARGGWPSVSGAGRAPTIGLRHASAFSLRSQSHAAFEKLLRDLRASGATVIMTFPSGRASNGMSGNELQAMARERFALRATSVPHVHSTLGGIAESRGARRSLDELVLVLRPN
jgi:adenine-specific DNA-methyltransferase